MKVFILAACLAVVLAVGAYFVLAGLQESSEMAYTSSAVRLDTATN